MRAAVSGRKSLDRTKSNPREELRSYLLAPLEAVDNVLLWWGVSPRCIMVLLICLTHFSNMLCSIRRLPEWPVITLRYKALPPPLNVLSHKEALRIQSDAIAFHPRYLKRCRSSKALIAMATFRPLNKLKNISRAL